MNIKVKASNFVALAVFGFITSWLGNSMAHGSLQNAEMLFVPAFFSFLAFVGFVIGFFAYGNNKGGNN